MSYLVEKPKHKTDKAIYRRSLLADILYVFSPSTPFRFEVDQPLDACATFLKKSGAEGPPAADRAGDNRRRYSVGKRRHLPVHHP